MTSLLEDVTGNINLNAADYVVAVPLDLSEPAILWFERRINGVIDHFSLSGPAAREQWLALSTVKGRGLPS